MAYIMYSFDFYLFSSVSRHSHFQPKLWWSLRLTPRISWLGLTTGACLVFASLRRLSLTDVHEWCSRRFTTLFKPLSKTFKLAYSKLASPKNGGVFSPLNYALNDPKCANYSCQCHIDLVYRQPRCWFVFGKSPSSMGGGGGGGEVIALLMFDERWGGGMGRAL